MTTSQLTKVVHIGSGEVIEIAPMSPLHYQVLALHDWVLYDESREYAAQLLRQYVEHARKGIAEAESQLLDLYREVK